MASAPPKVNEALEKERQAKKIGKSLEAEILVEGIVTGKQIGRAHV